MSKVNNDKWHIGPPFVPFLPKLIPGFHLEARMKYFPVSSMQCFLHKLSWIKLEKNVIGRFIFLSSLVAYFFFSISGPLFGLMPLQRIIAILSFSRSISTQGLN